MKPATSEAPTLDTTLVDYIRLATFDSVAFLRICAELERKYHDWKPHKWQQYKGRKSTSSVFHGIGEQAGRAHYIVQVSGFQAHAFWRWWRDRNPSNTNAFYATRIDLQRTRERPLLEHRVKAYKRLRGTKSLIQSTTGITLYIGNRTSDTYWRLYDKTEKHLRCELEIKGRQVKRAWIAMSNGESVGGVFNRFLKQSRVPQVYVNHFWADTEAVTLPEIETRVDYAKKLNWLYTLDGLVYKLANDHDTQEDLAVILDRWLEYVKDVDRPDKPMVHY